MTAQGTHIQDAHSVLQADLPSVLCVQKSKVVEPGQEEHIINEKRVMAILDSPF